MTPNEMHDAIHNPDFSRIAVPLTLTVLLGILVTFSGCRKGPMPTGPKVPDEMILIGGDVPLSDWRLQGAQLQAIRSGTTWDLTNARFTLANRDGPLPADIAASVLGPGTTANRVVGDWRFDGQAGVMILSNMESDGRKVDATVSLPIHPAGAVRADFGTEQYNIMRPARVPD